MPTRSLRDESLPRNSRQFSRIASQRGGTVEFAEEIFNEMAPAVHVEVTFDGLGPIGFRRDDGNGAAVVQFGAQPIHIEGFVGEQSLKVDALISGATPTLSWRWPGIRTKRERLPAHRPAPGFWSSGRRAIDRWPDFESPFCAGAMLVDPNDCAVDHRVLEIRVSG